VTVPLPVPLDAPGIVSHGALDVATHAHVGVEAVTVTVPVPPSAVTFAVVGEMVNVHDGGGGGVPDCVTVTVRPASVTVADRSAPLLAATVSVTLVSPLPLVALSVTHGTPLDAVHAQLPCAASIRTIALPPDAPIVTVVGATVNVQGNAAWVIVNV
jgi:hypothetical protein